MREFSFMIVFLTLFASCEEERVKMGENIKINLQKANESSLREISSNPSYINLNFPEGVSIGEISHIKSYNNHLFLHDQFQTKTITVIDTLGNLINQLNKIGRGPGEYSNIDSFSFDEEKNELIIYDRALGNYSFYSFPELNHIKTIQKNTYIMNFEVLDPNHWFVLSDEELDENRYRGAEFWDENLDVQSSLSRVGQDFASIDVSYPNTISRVDDAILYSYPNEQTTVFKINGEEQAALISIDFGENSIPAEYWKLRDPYEFEEALTSGNPKATWVQNLVLDEETVAFWFLYKDIDTQYFATYNRKSEKSEVFTEIRIAGSNIHLGSPKGVYDNKYIHTIYPEYIDSAMVENKDLKNAISKNTGKTAPILVIYGVDG